MMKILCVTDWYLPAYKAGGPVRSLSNLISALSGSDFEFFVLTRDRDVGDRSPYTGVPLETWTTLSSTNVFYTGEHSLANFRQRINDLKPDIVYVNSFFSTFARKVLLLHRLGRLRCSAVIIAPRGELSPGALRIKWPQKNLYLKLAALTGLYKDLFWHATAELEKQEIKELLSSYKLTSGNTEQISNSIHVASNVPGSLTGVRETASLGKHPGEVRFLFVSRVSPKKNLKLAIELMANLRGHVTFDIYGPVDDVAYWQSCKALMAQAPANVMIRYCGAIPHDEAQRKYSEYHFFLFPTFGENYGHVIAESLAAGCPVLISDKTPWSGLEQKNIGWDLPLNQRGVWVETLQRCIDMDGETHGRMSLDCARFFREWARSPAIREENLRLFRKALACRNSVFTK